MATERSFNTQLPTGPVALTPQQAAAQAQPAIDPEFEGLKFRAQMEMAQQADQNRAAIIAAQPPKVHAIDAEVNENEIANVARDVSKFSGYEIRGSQLSPTTLGHVTKQIRNALPVLWYHNPQKALEFENQANYYDSLRKRVWSSETYGDFSRRRKDDFPSLSQEEASAIDRRDAIGDDAVKAAVRTERDKAVSQKYNPGAIDPQTRWALSILDQHERKPRVGGKPEIPAAESRQFERANQIVNDFLKKNPNFKGYEHLKDIHDRNESSGSAIGDFMRQWGLSRGNSEQVQDAGKRGWFQGAADPNAPTDVAGRKENNAAIEEYAAKDFAARFPQHKFDRNEFRKIMEAYRIAGTLYAREDSELSGRGVNNVPKEMRDLVVMAMGDIAKSRGDRGAQDYAKKFATSIATGMENMLGPFERKIDSVLGTSDAMSDEDMIFRNQLKGSRNANDPMTKGGIFDLPTAGLSVAENLPLMIPSGRLGQLAGGLAKARGAGAVVAGMATSAGVAAPFIAPQYEQSYVDMIEQKVDPGTASVAAAAISTIAGLIEAVEPDPLHGKAVVAKTLRQSLTKRALSLAGRVAKEASEEYAQGFVDEFGQEIAKQMSVEGYKPDYIAAVQGAIQQGNQAILPTILMMSPGGAHQLSMDPAKLANKEWKRGAPSVHEAAGLELEGNTPQGNQRRWYEANKEEVDRNLSAFFQWQKEQKLIDSLEDMRTELRALEEKPKGTPEIKLPNGTVVKKGRPDVQTTTDLDRMKRLKDDIQQAEAIIEFRKQEQTAPAPAAPSQQESVSPPSAPQVPIASNTPADTAQVPAGEGKPALDWDRFVQDTIGQEQGQQQPPTQPTQTPTQDQSQPIQMTPQAASLSPAIEDKARAIWDGLRGNRRWEVVGREDDALNRASWDSLSNEDKAKAREAFGLTQEATQEPASDATTKAPDWDNFVQDTIGPSAPTTPNVIDNYKAASPELKALFESDAGVKEGYTVEQHTRMVQENWRQQIPRQEMDDLGDRLQIDRLGDLMEHVVALHDIGKPQAVAMGNKALQHQQTLPILERELRSQGYGEKEIALAKALVGNDAIGELLKGKKSAGQAAKALAEKAKEAGVPLNDFLTLQSSLYKSDAGAYPELRSSLFNEGPGGKLTLPSVEYGILEEMVYGQVREADWLERTGPAGKQAGGSVADRGDVRRYVHGTAVRFDNYDESKDSGRNRVGKGLYILDSADSDVAEHYTRRAVNRALALFTDRARKAIFAASQETLAAESRKFRDKADAFEKAGNTKQATRHREGAALLDEVAAGRIGKFVLDVEFSPRSIFQFGSEESGGRQLSQEELSDILKQVPQDKRKAIESAIAGKNRAFQVYDAMAKALSGRNQATDVLRAMGYDAIQFVHVKGGFSRSYNVLVSLKPDAAKLGERSEAKPRAGVTTPSTTETSTQTPSSQSKPQSLSQTTPQATPQSATQTTPKATQESESVLKQSGLTIQSNKTMGGRPSWSVSGNTFSNKTALQQAGGRYDGRAKAWVFSGENPGQRIADAIRNQPGYREDEAVPGDRGGVSETLAGHAQQRRDADRQDTHDGGIGEDRNRYVSGVTQDLLRRGLEHNIPQEVIDEQIEDVALINRAFQTGKRLFLLASEPGTGKSFVLGGAIREMAKKADRIIYVTTSQDLIAQLRADLKDYLPHGKRVDFVTYAKMRDGSVDATGAVLVMDEAHNSKNDGSLQGAAAEKLMRQAQFTVLASATPFENPVQAAYLRHTGVFGGGDPKSRDQAFIDWAETYGATKYGPKDDPKVRWSPKNEQRFALEMEARDWFQRRGIFSQRSKRLPQGAVYHHSNPVAVAPEWVDLYNNVIAAYDNVDTSALRRPSDVDMHRVNTVKRILESSKINHAIKRAKQLIAQGKQVIIFVETKAEKNIGRYRKSGDAKGRLYTYPEISRMMEEWRQEKKMAQMMRDKAPPPPFAEFIEKIAESMHAAGIDREIEPGLDTILREFDAKDVALYTGAQTAKQATKQRLEWMDGKRKLLVATMAKGGTGLSFHDTTGKHPQRVQILLNLPWTATQVDQVLGRLPRYGLTKQAGLESIHASNIPFEVQLANRVGNRMRDMGAIVKGEESEHGAALSEGQLGFARGQGDKPLGVEEKKSLKKQPEVKSESTTPASPTIEENAPARAMPTVVESAETPDVVDFKTGDRVSYVADGKPGIGVIDKKVLGGGYRIIGEDGKAKIVAATTVKAVEPESGKLPGKQSSESGVPAPTKPKPQHEPTDTIAGRMTLDEFEAKGYQPDEVTRSEWVEMQRKARRAMGQSEESGTRFAPYADYEEFHKQAVKAALAKGEEVDERVLADYPEFQPKVDAPEVDSVDKPDPNQDSLPEGFWDHEPYAKEVASKMLIAQKMDEAIRDNVADEALKYALTTYDPKKAKGKSLKNWIKEIVQKRVRTAAKQAASKAAVDMGDKADQVTAPSSPSSEDQAEAARQQAFLDRNPDLAGKNLKDLKAIYTALGGQPGQLREGPLLEAIDRLRTQKPGLPAKPAASTMNPKEDSDNGPDSTNESDGSGGNRATRYNARPLSTLGQTGRPGSLALADGTTASVTYHAVEIDDILPSHDARRNFAINEGAYPNQRPYHDPDRGKADRIKVWGMVKYDPSKAPLVTSDVLSSVDGPPITTPDGYVLGGNGRSMGIQLAYHEGGENAAQWKQLMVDSAQKFGLDPQAVAGMKEPIIVRALDLESFNSRSDWSDILNEGLGAGRSQATLASSRGKKVSNATAALIAAKFVPDSDGGFPSLAEVLGSKKSAREIVEALRRDGAWTNADMVRFTDPSSGEITNEGKISVEQILLGRLISDPDVLPKTMEQAGVKQKLLTAIGPLTRGLADPTHGADLQKVILDAVDSYPAYKAAQGKAQNLNTREFFLGPSMFDFAGKGDKAVAAIVDGLERMGPKKFTNAITDVLKALRVETGEKQTSMFDDMLDANNARDAIVDVFWGGVAGDGIPRMRMAASFGRRLPSITKTDVARVFPGATIRETATGFQVEVGDSYLTIERAGKIEIDWKDVEDKLGRKVPKSMRETAVAAGSFSVKLPDGTRHTGLGLIRMAEGIADDGKLRHEALHLAKEAGLIGEQEWQALVDAYAKGETNPDVQEERIARAMETPPEIASVWGRVASWIRRLLSRLGIGQYQARDVRQLMQEAGFWARAKSSDGTGGPRYSINFRPDLANPGTSPEVRNLVDETDARRNAEGRPETRSDAEVQARAEEMIQSDYSAARDLLVRKGRTGGQLLDHETLAAKTIINREACEAITTGDKKRLVQAMSLIEAYRETGAEQARAFRQRFDPVESPAERAVRALHEAILDPPQKLREQRNKARREGRHEEADRINEQWAERFEELKQKLLALGVDIDNLNEAGYSKIKAQAALRAISAAKADAWDKMYEYWNNAILSALTTQSANIIGNAMHGTWSLTAERLIEATANVALQRPEGAQLGELKYMLAGILPGISRGARNFFQAWATESPVLEVELGKGDTSQKWSEGRNVAIGGKLGRVIRMPWRALGAFDDFFKSLFVEVEVGARAYRIAKGEGLKGEAMQKRIADLTADIESPAWAAAYDSALELAFQQKGGKVLQSIKRNITEFRGGHFGQMIGARYIIPYVNTPVNIFATAMKKSPLGSVNLLSQMWSNYHKGDPVFKGLTVEVAQQAIAWALVMVLVGNDPEDPWITGSAEGMSREGREVGYRAIPPLSVKIGGKYHSYSRIEPFATAIGTMVDWVNAFKSGKRSEITEIPIKSVIGQIGSKTFLSGVGSIITAMEAEKPSGKLMTWASNFSTSWVPNIIRSTIRESDSEYMNRRVWGQGDDWNKMLGKRTLQKTELTTFKEYPIYDVWGRPGKKSESPIGADWLYRMIVPVRNQDTDIFIADRVLLNWNNRNPEDAALPLSPQPYYQRKGKTYYMTEGQYADFCKAAGELARKRLEKAPLDPDNPTKRQVEFIKETVSKARHATLERMIPQWRKEAAQTKAQEGSAP